MKKADSVTGPSGPHRLIDYVRRAYGVTGEDPGLYHLMLGALRVVQA